MFFFIAHMTILKHKLIAPNSLPIVGLKIKNGPLTSFEYSYDTATKTSMYVLPENSMSGSSDKDSTVLVDSNGNEWASVDVEFHSLLHSK